MRRKEVHIFTCGVSVLDNLIRKYEGKRSELITRLGRQLKEGRDINELVGGLDDSELERLRKIATEYIKERPEEASAEIKAFIRYLGKRGLSVENAGELVKKVYLLVSNTRAGMLAGEVIKEYLRGINVPTSTLTITGFERMDFKEALKELKREIKPLIGAFKKVVLNLTGGFKPEIAVLSAMAAENGLSSYYIYRGAEDVVELPVNHITLKLKNIANLRDLLMVVLGSVLSILDTVSPLTPPTMILHTIIMKLLIIVALTMLGVRARLRS